MTLDFTTEPNDELRRPEAEGAMFAPTPIYARTTRKAGGGGFRGVPKAALVALPLGLFAIAAGAYQLTRPTPAAVAEQAPMPRETLMASAAHTPAPPPTPEAMPTASTPTANSSVSTPEDAAPVTTPTVRRERATRVAAAPRARPAARSDSSSAASAASAGEDASATIPAAPLPYSAPAGTPAQPPAVVVTPPPPPVPPESAAATP